MKIQFPKVPIRSTKGKIEQRYPNPQNNYKVKPFTQKKNTFEKVGISY